MKDINKLTPRIVLINTHYSSRVITHCWFYQYIKPYGPLTYSYFILRGWVICFLIEGVVLDVAGVGAAAFSTTLSNKSLV